MTTPSPEHPPSTADTSYGDAVARRLEVEVTPLLKLHLQDWEDEKKQQLASVESYRGRCHAAKSDLYQLMGFYFVFQGVVFTAVSSSSRLTCQTSFLPAVLSGLASIATAASIHLKLTYYSIQKLKFIRAEQESDNIIRKIRLLKSNGRRYDFGAVKDTQQLLQQKVDAEKKHLNLNYRVVMFFLAIVTLMIIASCFIVLCSGSKFK